MSADVAPVRALASTSWRLTGRLRGQQGQAKMSKSDPNSAIFMEDSEAEVAAKIKKAFCPPPPSPPAAADGVAAAADGAAAPAEEWRPQDNPCLEYVRMIILPRFGRFEVSGKDGARSAAAQPRGRHHDAGCPSMPDAACSVAAATSLPHFSAPQQLPRP
jgi:hypothetical protein